MKLLIASDIHGSAYYCEKLVDAYKREGADKLLLLGDILYHGPRNDLPHGHSPKEVISLLNPLADKIVCVRGNCEAEVDQMVLDFPVLDEYAVLDVDGTTLFATHGHHINPQSPPKRDGFFVLLNGHTHVPDCAQYDGFLYVNPGSVSIPKNGSAHSYVTFDGKKFEWKSLDGIVYMTK